MTAIDLLVVTLLFAGGGQVQPDALESVRQLYASAEYESALAALERISSEDAPAEGVESRRYRALCLMALGRTADAEKAIEEVLSIDPSYQADEQDPPRVRSAYATVRARVLPQVARSAYTNAKAAYDRREFEAAASGFVRTIDLLGLLESADPALDDLRTLASGFLDLSRAVTKPAAPAASPEPAATASAAQDATAPATTPSPDRDVPTTPPVVVAQELPPWNPAAFGSQFQSEFRGAIEVTIDERGMVTAATIVEPVHPAYDLQLLEAARGWHYQPASRGGEPVVSVKRVDIVLRPR